MAKFTINITAENAAFEGDDLAGEIIYILRSIEVTLEQFGMQHGHYFTKTLHDSNGNTIGKYTFTK